jgi:hypothetical protein
MSSVRVAGVTRTVPVLAVAADLRRATHHPKHRDPAGTHEPDDERAGQQQERGAVSAF